MVSPFFRQKQHALALCMGCTRLMLTDYPISDQLFTSQIMPPPLLFAPVDDVLCVVAIVSDCGSMMIDACHRSCLVILKNTQGSAASSRRMLHGIGRRRLCMPAVLLHLSPLMASARSVVHAPPVPNEEEVGPDGVRKRPFGSAKADEDAFGHTDAFAAVRESIEEARKHKAATDAATDAAATIDEAASAVNRRKNKKKKTMDNVLGEVLHDALRMRDMGAKPDMDFIYKQTQERVYEAEHGRKPPSQKEQNAKYIPFPPDFHLIRLLPNTLFDDDPWPERSITAENPVLNVHELERDKQRNQGRLAKEQEKMFLPREGRDPVEEFGDAVDELSYWEVRFVDFVREVPVSQRRTLPLLHEQYRALTHRLIRAEKRFITTRDFAMSRAKISPSAFAMTEDRVERVRSFYADTHKSLSSPNFDPVKMKKGMIGKLMGMAPDAYAQWKLEEASQRNTLIAEFSPC